MASCLREREREKATKKKKKKRVDENLMVKMGEKGAGD
jgi:hypothetical protein